ncbi:hypothetical protein RB620_12645 [Paenibacillus sp. LHD-117]|nr:hypothetical protein [Paenibacillus sp. LHD-117]MDQ6420284.1 hypothetical protein [Paenibacillus sp. LHD-117]
MSFDDLLKELQEQRANPEEQASLGKLFNEGFMSKYSNCRSMQEFLEKGNFQAWSTEDMALIPEELLNRHVARETKFADWKSMLDKATTELAGQS